MNDLISREAAIKMLQEKAQGYVVSMFATMTECNIAKIVAMECANELNGLPVIDAELVRRGVWEWYEDWWNGECDEYGWRCSVCGVSLADSIEEAISERPDLDDPDKVPTMKRCPNCEARMDLEDDDE